jgi:hypothetical protein
MFLKTLETKQRILEAWRGFIEGWLRERHPTKIAAAPHAALASLGPVGEGSGI